MIPTKQSWYVDVSGRYLGSWAGSTPPTGARKVPRPPDHGLQRWTGTTWVDLPAREAERKRALVTPDRIMAALKAKGTLVDADLDT